MLKVSYLLKIVFIVLFLSAGIFLYFKAERLTREKETDLMEKNVMIDYNTVSTAENKVLKRDGYNIHYYTSGDKSKDAIVFLHPAFADHRCFNKQLDSFSKEFYIITIDMLGHGQSAVEKAKDKIDATADQLNEILEKEGHAKAHFAGVSMGTLIAQHYAFLHPEKVLSLTIVSGYNIHKEDSEVKNRQRLESLKWLYRAVFSMDSFRKYVARVSVKDPAEQVRLYEMGRSFTRKSFTVMSGLSNIIQPGEPQQRSYPLLLISGEHDIEISKKLMRKWKEEEPESFYHHFSRAGHCVNMDEGPKFNELLIKFCKGELVKPEKAVNL